MIELLDSLAARHELLLETGKHFDGSWQAYLYSPDMVYRYAFTRWWAHPDASTTAVWVLLNPATGDTEQRRRPTLDRCIAWSKRSGFVGLTIVNLFAFRHTDPRALRTADNPTGPVNDEVLRAVTTAGGKTIAAWGSHGRLNARSTQVAPLLKEPMCLGTTRTGEPLHPLYVPADRPLTAWAPQPAP
ncbi:DUF1643 domain-containing protein [uncultured Cellulomonas sp.]|uniref:DUF1643 domain-containing protein n=1 Tax=uncultured Cellulomonas sp. TaxID=189682 RepID=UPI0026102076|nr:DUF1643 domain-containing protein [uncultured Cellulomonas sp.]